MTSPVNTQRIGLQLYSVQDLVAQDLPGTLETIARLGYDGVEFAGLAGNSAIATRRVLDRVGLTAVGAHLSLEDLEERADETIADLRGLGCQTAIVAWLPPEQYVDEATAGRTVDRLVAAGQIVRGAGIRFAYHNHDFEFQPVGSTTLWSLLLDVPADSLPLEVDVYWVRHAGLDPTELIRTLGSRVALIHAKDTAAVAGAGDAAVGVGIERWPDLLTACDNAGVEWLVVEQEHSTDILADVETSLLNLRRLLA